LRLPPAVKGSGGQTVSRLYQTPLGSSAEKGRGETVVISSVCGHQALRLSSKKRGRSAVVVSVKRQMYVRVLFRRLDRIELPEEGGWEFGAPTRDERIRQTPVTTSFQTSRLSSAEKGRGETRYASSMKDMTDFVSPRKSEGAQYTTSQQRDKLMIVPSSRILTACDPLKRAGGSLWLPPAVKGSGGQNAFRPYGHYADRPPKRVEERHHVERPCKDTSQFVSPQKSEGTSQLASQLRDNGASVPSSGGSMLHRTSGRGRVGVWAPTRCERIRRTRAKSSRRTSIRSSAEKG